LGDATLEAVMATITVAAVQAAYVLMDRKATVAKVEELLADPAVRAADLVLFPEAFVPGHVRSARRLFDPVGHYHRPDVFRLAVDTAPRPVVTTLRNGLTDDPN